MFLHYMNPDIMNININLKKRKYSINKPNFTLIIPKTPDLSEYLPELTIATQLFTSYNHSNKKICWTSMINAQKEIQTATKTTIVLNLVPNECYTTINKNVTIFHVPIADDILSGSYIANNFDNILNCFNIWNKLDNADLLIHCTMGIHRSFTVATILAMFMYHQKNNSSDFIPTQKDYFNFIDIVQSCNKYSFSAANLDDSQLKHMFQKFIVNL